MRRRRHDGHSRNTPRTGARRFPAGASFNLAMPIGRAANRGGRSPPGSRAASAAISRRLVAREGAGAILFALDLIARTSGCSRSPGAKPGWRACIANATSLKSQPLGNSCRATGNAGRALKTHGNGYPVFAHRLVISHLDVGPDGRSRHSVGGFTPKSGPAGWRRWW
jgi:hypothetical protein